MITRSALADFLNDYLDCAAYRDYAPNGLQIEGRATIQRICTAVTASQEVIERAIDWRADALIVHHGYFWRGEDAVITGMRRARIAAIVKHDLNLFAYHLPLDGHPVLGNNACIAERLQIQDKAMHPVANIPNLLWTGNLPKPLSSKQFSQHMTTIFQQTPQHIAGSDKKIQSIAFCSGAAQDYIVDAHQLGVDAYMSGEISERTYYQAKELGLHYFACGHHATERFGVQALGAYLHAQFDLTCHFLDTQNPV